MHTPQEGKHDMALVCWLSDASVLAVWFVNACIDSVCIHRKCMVESTSLEKHSFATTETIIMTGNETASALGINTVA